MRVKQSLKVDFFFVYGPENPMIWRISFNVFIYLLNIKPENINTLLIVFSPFHLLYMNCEFNYMERKSIKYFNLARCLS